MSTEAIIEDTLQDKKERLKDTEKKTAVKQHCVQ